MPETTLTIPIRSDKLSMNVLATEHLYHEKTEFQTIDIYSTEAFGRVLLLDGHIQLTEMDERAYHEALVHVPLLSLRSPTSALVVGGGDGGVIRELCRHKSLTRIDMVEIDSGVVEACKEFLPFVNGASFSDPRVNLSIADAFQYVKTANTKYDLVVVDATDVYEDEEGELSEMLFTSAFYDDLKAVLKDTGIVVTQADNHIFCPYSMEAIIAQFQKTFPKVGHYQALVPSFGGFSAFVYGCQGANLAHTWSAVDASDLGLRYLNESTYNLAFRPLRFG